MKKSVSVLIVLLFATSSFALENPWDKKLPFKSATIDYKVAGTMSGEKTVYIKDYGRTTAEYSNTSMKMFGMTQQQKEIIITTPDWVYSRDMVGNTATRQANPKKFMIREFNRLSKAEQKKVTENAERFGIATIEGMDGKLQKNAAKIMGYKCDKVSLMGTIVYTISGTDLPLKIQGNTMGIKINQVATNIKKGGVAPSKFDLASNIDFVHDKQADLMMQAQAEGVIQSLLQGKRPDGLDGDGQNGQNADFQQQYKEMQQYQAQQQAHEQQQQSQAGQMLKQDANDVGQAARQEIKDATVEEVKEGVRNLFKSVFE